MKKLLHIICLTFGISAFAEVDRKLQDASIQEHKKEMEKIMNGEHEKMVQKKVLSNGMTVLVRPVHVIPRVSLQIWYNVGSKDEKTGERGIAHLIEHMIFKGTKKLSESDINVITHKLSGSTNAFTSYDYTGYLFNMPVQHWKEVLPIMADCMLNVSFKDDHLNSEMKAVIQELKLYRDNYPRSLIMEVLSSMFPDHPYHFPVIGFKQDLWNVHGEDLRKFYKKHYWPNNATLVVVGDVDADDVFKTAEKLFGSIPANPHYQKEEFFLNQDIIARNVTMYRDVQQPVVALMYLIPGAESKIEPLLDVINIILGGGKASRLWRKLVDELHLAASVEAGPIMLNEHGMYIISFEPNKIEDAQRIIDIIQQEIDSIVENGLTEKELTRAVKQAQMSHYRLLESIEAQAYEIGKAYIATGDPDFAFKYLTEASAEVEQDIQRLLGQYFRPSVRHQGMILPLPEREKPVWQELQKESDALDTAILATHPRTSPVEPPLYANKIEPKEAPYFDFPKPQSFVLSNGIKVLYYHTDTTPKIDVKLQLKAKEFYEPEDKAGVYRFMTSLLQEGTEKYTATELAEELETAGISLNIAPGGAAMSMLSSDLERAMTLLEEVLSRPRFDEQEIEKVRTQFLVGLKNFWDDPASFSGQLIEEEIYKGHPYSKRTMGTEASIKAMTRKDLIEYHKKFITPFEARLAIVGDIQGYDLKSVLEKTIGKWKGPKVEDITFPKLAPVKAHEMVYPINRDQVVLALAGLSVTRKDKDFDKLVLFDQIFGAGALGSMHSRLFALREQSGLFYGISGSLTSDCNEQPGLVMVKTKVSLDRLDEAEKAIKNAIDTATKNVTDQELSEARGAIINSIINFFASNQSIAQVFLNIDRYGLPLDYFDKRNETLSKITKEAMIDAVKSVLSSSKMVTLKIGRLDAQRKKESCS